MPNLFSALPVVILAWVLASTSGLTRIETGATAPRAAAIREIWSSSGSDSTLKQRMPLSRAWQQQQRLCLDQSQLSARLRRRSRTGDDASVSPHQTIVAMTKQWPTKAALSTMSARPWIVTTVITMTERNGATADNRQNAPEARRPLGRPSRGFAVAFLVDFDSHLDKSQ